MLLTDFQVGTSQLIKTQSLETTLKNGVALAKTATNTPMVELAQDWSTPRSQRLMPILFDLLPPIQEAA